MRLRIRPCSRKSPCLPIFFTGRRGVPTTNATCLSRVRELPYQVIGANEKRPPATFGAEAFQLVTSVKLPSAKNYRMPICGVAASFSSFSLSKMPTATSIIS
jgi:hypothetical protein